MNQPQRQRRRPISLRPPPAAGGGTGRGRTSTIFAFLSALLLAATPTLAADVTRLFQYQADIVAPPGPPPLLRLVLPAEVIAKTRADRSDVRIFDAQGHVVPFVTDSGVGPGERREVNEFLDVKVIDVRREQKKAKDAPPVFREEYEIEVPPPPAGTSWVLVFDSDRPELIRRVELSTPGSAALPLASASIFRLRGGEVARNTVAVPLLEGNRLRVVLDGADSFLDPQLRLRAATVLERGERTLVPLEILTREEINGRTVLEVARPDGVVPDLIRIETSTPSYYRTVQIADGRQGGAARVLAHAPVFRLDAGDDVASTDLRLVPPQGERLRIEIDDGDSPPLADLRVSAEVRQPALFFNLPGSSGVLRFGGGRAARARYDLEPLAPTDTGAQGELARLRALLLDRAQSRVAALRDIRANPQFDTSPLLAFAMQPGAAVELESYSHRRAVRIDASPDGLARLRLEPADLAIARADLADLRLVDAEGRQWPYLLHPGAARAWVPLDVGAVERKGGVSSYRLGLPAAPLQVEAVELSVDQPFYSRPFRLVAGGKPERVVAQGKLARAAGSEAASTIDVGGDPVEELTLRMNDGDEAALPIVAARAAIVVPDVYVIAPQGEYSLLLGDPEARAPRYDLADAREAVLSVIAVPATAGALETNPAQGWRQRWFSGGYLQQGAVWLVLGVAVVVLGLLTLRLVRE